MARATLEMFLKLSGANKTSQGLDKVSKSTKDLDSNIKNSTKKNAEFAAGMSGLAKGAIVGASVLAAKSLIDFSKSALNAAVDAEEAGAAFDTTFGTAAQRATQFLEEFANKAGLTVGEAQQLQSVLGAVAQGIGFTQEASADLSIELTKIAADVASFSNISAGAEPVLQAFRSALVGEREALKTYGIAITEADVQTKAFEQTGKDSADALNRQEKALATLALIQEKAAVQIGDLDRTMGSFANQSRALNAELRQLREEIGAELIPVAAELLPIMREFAFEVAPALIKGFGGFAKNISDVTLGVRQFKEEMSFVDILLMRNTKTFEQWADIYRENQVVQDRYIDKANLSAIQTAFLSQEQEKSRQSSLKQQVQFKKVADTIDNFLNPIFGEQNSLLLTNIQLETDRSKLLKLVSSANDDVAQATSNRNQAAKELQELQIQENVRDAEAAIRKAELQTQIALLTQAQESGKNVALDLALAQAELAEAEFELKNDSDRLTLARERLDLAEQNLEISIQNQNAAIKQRNKALVESIDLSTESKQKTDDLSKSLEKQLDIYKRFRAFETAPDLGFPRPDQDSKPDIPLMPEPTTVPVPTVSDNSNVDTGLRNSAATDVTVKVELSDNAEDFLQVTQERLAKKGYAIR
tara:strand:- start:1548 stop:3476 length:1929 start_codon:yes stop_codon:yes gene_type:complete